MTTRAVARPAGALALAGLTALATVALPRGAATAARADEAGGPDIVAVTEAYLAARSPTTADGLVVQWTSAPAQVRAADAAGDQYALDAASQGVTPPGDLLGFAHGRTGALDAATVAALFGPDGPLAPGTPGVYAPPFAIDSGAFAGGAWFSFLRTDGPLARPTRPGTNLIAAVQYGDPRFASPGSGNFAGINKVHRLEVRPEGSALAYAQYDGTRFAVFRSTVVVADTCAVVELELCGLLFVSAAAGREHEGVQSIGAELFWGDQQAQTNVTDRIGDGLGTLLPTTAAAPGDLGQVPRPVPTTSSTAAATTSAAPTTTQAPDTAAGAAAPSTAAAAPTTGATPAAAAATTAAPTPAAGAPDGGGGGGGLALVPVGVAAGGALAYAIYRVRRRPDPAPTVLSFMEDVSTTPSPDDVRDRWARLLVAEDEVQARLLADYRRIGGVLASNMQTLASATHTFNTGFEQVAWNAQWLAGVAEENRSALAVTSAIDLTLGVADAGVSIWSLGAAGWNRLFGAGDEAVDAASDATAATQRAVAYGPAELAVANAKIAENPALLEIANAAGQVTMTTHVHWRTYTRGLDTIFTEAAVLADRAGADFAAAAASRVRPAMSAGDLENALVALWVDMAEAAAQAKGFVRASEETRDVLRAVTVNARTFCNGGVVGSASELRGVVDAFSTMAAQPGFFDTAGSLYTVVGGAGTALGSRGDTALELLFHADDLAFMRWLSDAVAGGTRFEDLPQLWQTTMGPIARAGDELAQGVSVGIGGSGAHALYSVSQGINNTIDYAAAFAATSPLAVSSVLPDGVTYLAQYGILRPTFLGMEAGDSLPVTVLFNGINSVGGFASWLTGMRASIEGGVLHDDAIEELRPTFTSMSLAALDVVNALEVIGERVSTDSISNEDRRQLASILEDMTATVAGAPPDVRTELAPQLDARRAHITAKLAQLDAVQGALVQAAGQLPAIARALDERVRADRSGAEWADPGLWQGIGVATSAAGLTVQTVLRPPVAVVPADGAAEPSATTAAAPGPARAGSNADFMRRINAEDPVEDE